MINIFILCADVIIEHIFVGFIQTMVVHTHVFIKKSSKKIDFPLHVIIEESPMCRKC